MKLTLLLALFFLLGATTRPALALPPPWELEIKKAQADLILIAVTAEPVACQDVPRATRRVTLKPLVVLKGKLPLTDDKKTLPNVALVYSPPGDDPHRGMGFVGGPVDPTVKKGETVLVFLKRASKGDDYRCAAGAMGYVVLKVGAEKELNATHKRLQMFQEVCQHIEDAAVRKQMDGYYRRAAAFAEKLAKQKDTR